MYRSRDGRPLSAGVFFRADNLGRLDVDGSKKLRDLGVKTVVDLRTADEIRETPNPFERDRSVAFHSIDMVGDSHDIIARGDTIESVNRDERLPNGYFADPVDEYRSQFCPPGAMEETLEHLHTRYGGAVAYLDHIGVDARTIETIRERFLGTV